MPPRLRPVTFRHGLQRRTDVRIHDLAMVGGKLANRAIR